MKKLLLTLALLLALAITLASCDFVAQPPNDGSNNGDNGSGENGGTENEGGNTEHIHTFGEWVTITEPTCTNDGAKERSCGCGKKKTQK